MSRDEEQEMTGWRKRTIMELAKESGLPIIWMSDTGVLKWSDLEAFAKLVREDERERIKQANAPEIERVNAHIKQLEDAVLAEREACAKVCEHFADVDSGPDGIMQDYHAHLIRARGEQA